MLPSYDDIRALTHREPEWYDGHGTPRYAPFHPDMLGVYDKWALLVIISCQSCNRRFLVGEGWTNYNFDPLKGQLRFYSLEDLATDYHYGDPPRHDCIGDSMNCVDQLIVSAWEKVYGNQLKWIRKPDIELIDIYPDWAK